MRPPGVGAPPPQGRPSQPPGQQSVDQAYVAGFTKVINSAEYKNEDEDDRKSRIGDYVYNYIVKLSSEEDAPKITGMIIDLEEKDLIESVRTYQGLKDKVEEGKRLLEEEKE